VVRKQQISTKHKILKYVDLYMVWSEDIRSVWHPLPATWQHSSHVHAYVHICTFVYTMLIVCMYALVVSLCLCYKLLCM